MRRGHVEAGEEPTQQGLQRRSVGPRSCVVAPVEVTTSATTRSAVTTCATRAARSPRRSLQISERHRFVVGSRASRPPRPFPHPLAQLGLASPVLARRLAPWRRACGARRGRPRPPRRAAPAPAARGSPASARAPTTRTAPLGDRDLLATRSPRTASRRPWPVTIVCRSRLPNELCHSCRSARPRRRCPSAAAGRPLRSARAARTSRSRSRTASGAVLGTRSARSRRRASSWSPRRRTTSARVEPDVDRPPAQLERVQLGGEVVAARHQRRPRPSRAAPQRRGPAPRP